MLRSSPINRFWRDLSSPGTWLLLLLLVVALPALGTVLRIKFGQIGPEIGATLHRRDTPGELVALGQKIELDSNEEVFYSFDFEPESRHLRFEVNGAISRIVLNGREISEDNRKIDILDRDRMDVQIELGEHRGDRQRLDLWMTPAGGFVAVKILNRITSLFVVFSWLCSALGAIALFLAAIGVGRWWKNVVYPRLCNVSAYFNVWSSSRSRLVLLGSVGLVALGAGILLCRGAQIQIREAWVLVDGGQPVQVTLPHYGSSAEGQISTYRGVFEAGLVTGSRIRLIPDDRLVAFSLNGQTVDLSTVPQWKLGDWGRGFELDIRHYMVPGPNTFEVQVVNMADPFGLSLQGTTSAGYVIGLLICVAGTAALLLMLCRQLGIRNGIAVLLIFAAGLRIFYWGYTGPYDRSYDVAGHLEHMHYIIDDHRLPASTECWECHQPSFYYLVSALAYILGQRLWFPEPTAVLVGLSLVLDLLFLIFSTLFFQEVSRRWVGQCCVLLFFWPSGILNSIRINNDAPMYAFAAGALLFGVRWMSAQRLKDMIWAAVFTLLVSISKISGLFILPVLVVIWLSVMLRLNLWRKAWLWKQTGLALGIMAAGIALLYADKFKERRNMTESERITPIVHTIDGSLRVANEFRNYWVFDLKDFLEEPYTHSREDSGGRQFFFNYFLKSSLFGEFHYYTPHAQVYVAHVLKGVLLVLVSVFMVGVLRSCQLGEMASVLITLFVSGLAAVLYFRMNLPFSCNQDFRYVYPILLGVIPLCVFGLEQAELYFGAPFFWVRRCLFPMWPLLAATFFLMPYFSI